MDIKIVKRDGTTEEFSIDKLITSIAGSGIPLTKSEEIARSLENWILQNAKDGKITSSQIRDEIIREISDDFPAEADSYKAFKKE